MAINQKRVPFLTIDTINLLSHKSSNNSCSTFKLALAYSLIGSVLDFSDKTSDFVSPYTEQVEEKIYFFTPDFLAIFAQFILPK